jgi:OOP family OmpA-OmpF porin
MEAKTIPTWLITFALTAAMVFAGSASADETNAQTSRGNAVVNSYGECWQSLDGATGLCGEPAPVDSDGDGVTDDKDQCPDTPQGEAVNEVGCPLDSDGDGVTDDKDQCPDTPHGVAVNEVGCPLDSDGDGVTDDIDKCPNTPEGAKVDSDGCMYELTLRNVEFISGLSQLTVDAKWYLESVADVLKGRPDIKKVTLVGHTDNVGSEADNQKLSEDRAASVANYLQRAGVTVPMETSGKGESQPIADNDTEEGRAHNRRVELSVEK